MPDCTHTEKAGDGQESAQDGALSPVEEKVAQEETLDPLYDMIKDGDVETLLPTTEDAVTEVHSLALVGSDPTVNYLNDGHGQGFMDENSDEEDTEEKEEPSSPTESEDLAAKRSELMAQMKVLDAMLRQVEVEDQQRALLEGPLVEASANDVNANCLHMGDSVSFKRQRRPNPKYFDADIEADFLVPGSSSSMAFRSYGEELPGPSGCSDGQSVQSAGNAGSYASAPNIAHATFSSFFDRSSVRPAGTHRARTALAHKPRVFSTPEDMGGATGAVKSDSYLDNLSIRELHEAYRTTFGRDTSVKDKHWLKRQISMGSNKQNGSSIGKENNRGNGPLAETSVKARLDKYSSAEAPLSEFESVGLNQELTGEVRPPGNSLCTDAALDTKRPHRKTVSLAILSPSGSSNPSPPTDGRENLGANSNAEKLVENKEIPVGGKRLRKPNRRYIEDEGDGSLGIGGNGSRSILSTYLTAGNGLRSGSLRLSWRSDAEIVGDGALRSTGIRASTRPSTCHGRRSKNGTKRKSEGRAAKLVKMAYSTRAARQDADGAVRKIKFRLPAAPGQDKGEVLNGGDGEQVSCLLPVLTDESSEDQILSSHYLSTLEDTSEQAVLTVPTANGGTRRKHHRPWTLREVVTLVEGVAHCGGGKWADIKKLAFSTVGYRTAVDLKDKWRNLLRASRAQLHSPNQGETRKKQFSASIPGHILARVRELAALNSQIVPATIAGSSMSRSGRTVHRR